MKKIISLFLVTISLIFIVGLTYNTGDDIKGNQIVKEEFIETEENYEIIENIDTSKPLLDYSFACIDYAILPPKNEEELFSSSSLILKGKVKEIKLVTDKDAFYSQTIAKVEVEEVYKGEVTTKTINISFMGGIISGENYIKVAENTLKIGAEKAKFQDGVDINIEEQKEYYLGKNIKLTTPFGEVLPEVGSEYLFFSEKSEVEESMYYLSGFEYAQSMFKIFKDNKINEFNPTLKEEIYNREVALGIGYDLEEKYEDEIPKINLNEFLEDNL